MTECFIKQIPLGPMANFVYLVGDAETRKAAVVDPAWDVKAILRAVQDEGYELECVLLTHGHMDHVNGLGELLASHPVPVYLSADEAEFYMPDCPGLRRLKDGDTVQIGGLQFECLLTPGHSPGSMCFRNGDVLIAGDVIFVDGCGRCDLPGGNAEQMYHSLHERIAKLPDSVIIYPGHDYGDTPTATVGQQKKSNPYLVEQSKEEFLNTRMG